MNKKKVAIGITAIIIVLISLAYVPSAHAETTAVWFRSGDISLGPDTGFTVRLDLQVTVSTSSPLILSGSNGENVDVSVSSGPAKISVTYLDNMYEQNFTTPIGTSVKIPVYEVGAITIYANLSGSIHANTEIKGDGAISPSVLKWANSGTQNMRVTYTGETYSYAWITGHLEAIAAVLRLQYILRLAVGLEILESRVEYPTDTCVLDGSQSVIQNLTILSALTVGITIFHVALFVAILGIFIIRKRRKHEPSQAEPEQ